MNSLTTHMKLKLLYLEDIDPPVFVGTVPLEVEVAGIFDTKQVMEQHLSEALDKKSASGHWILRSKDIRCVIQNDDIDRREEVFQNTRQ
jgi:hypothetical protein